MRAFLRVLAAVLMSFLAGGVLLAQVSGYELATTGLDEPTLDGGDTELELADVNGDGHLDLVSTGDHGNPLINTDQEGILVWLGDGAGNWVHVHFGHLGYGGIAVGDVNGDGLADVAYGIHHDYSSTDLGDQLLEVALGDGSGLSWTPWDDGLADEGQSWGLFATDLADVDADGDLDVGSTGFGASDGFQVYLNDGDGTWRRGFGFLGGNSDHVFVFGDVNGDAFPDVVTAKQEGTVWLGDGEGFFEVSDQGLPEIGTFAWRKGPSVGDVNHDGLDDIAYCDDAENPRVFLRSAAGSWVESVATPPASGHCDFTELADMDADGTLDLATFGRQWVHVVKGDGAGGAWTTLASFQTPSAPGSARAFRVGGDVDRNGRPDIALVAERTLGIFNDVNELFVYRETTLPDELRVLVTSPGSHRRYIEGTTTWIEWLTEAPLESDVSVRVELTRDGGPFLSIAEDLPDSGSLQWSVPGPPASSAQIRVEVRTGNTSAAALSAPFEIVRRPERLALSWTSPETLTWADELGRERFALYRGSWEALISNGLYTQDPALEPEAARWCDLAESQLADPFEPRPGRMVYYFVAGRRLMEDGQEPGVPVPMAESSLGRRSGGGARPHGASCPD